MCVLGMQGCVEVCRGVLSYTGQGCAEICRDVQGYVGVQRYAGVC